MIVVNNTKELELQYNLDKIPDDEKVVVLGGLAGKEKYNNEVYLRRVTYPARQIKQIISQMKEIEAYIPKEWNEWQKAKYIYEVLGKNISYNYNREEYKTQQPSNLSILLSRKGICAGYSLLFKEMMDRQSIPCDYIRGRAFVSREDSEKHAWNVLQINGYTFSVDLTWDSANLQIGNRNLEYFGCKEDFYKTHIQDNDEKNYNYYNFSKESVNSIDTSKSIKQTELSEENKKNIIKLAIEETYKKFKTLGSIENSRKGIENSILNYIKDGTLTGFTRQNNARGNIQQYITQESMVDVLIDEYVRNVNEESKKGIRNNDILSSSVQETSNIYGNEFIKEGLKNYLLNNETRGFTRQNNARQNIKEFMTPEQALGMIISKFVQQEISSIDKAHEIKSNNINNMTKIYFNGDEFAKVQLPKEKEENLIKRAKEWIKTKVILRRQLRDSELSKKEENTVHKESNQQSER